MRYVKLEGVGRDVIMGTYLVYFRTYLDSFW